MSELREAAKEALRWMEHARLHLTIKERMHPDGLSLYDSATEALRAALAQPKTELRDQHKAFAEWFLQQNPIAPNAEYLAWVAWKAALAEPKTELRDQHKAFAEWFLQQNPIAPNVEDMAWAAWKAALSAPDVPDVLDELPMPPAGHPLYKLGDRLAHYLDDDKFNECERLLLEGWNHDRIDRKTGEDWLDIEPPEEKPEVEPPRDEWREAVRDEWRPASEPPEDGRDVVVWCAQERRAVHGMYIRRRPPIAGLVDGWVAPDASELTHWRDVTPPTESPIAAKCQRIEGSGEICGLTPPCPDCGSSLIDVPEGSL